MGPDEHPALNADLYETAAENYAAHTAHNFCNAGYERPAMRTLFGNLKGARVLDAGCAAGGHIEYLLDCGADVVALDSSRPFIDMVKTLFGTRIEARVHDLNAPMNWLPSEQVDLVLCSLTLHYLPDWRVPLREFHRVLKPGGRLVMSTHHPASTAAMTPSYFDTVLVNDRWTVEGKEYAVRYYHRPLQSIFSSITDAGFSIDRLIEPRLDEDVPALSAEWNHRLRTQPWFLLVAANRA